MNITLEGRELAWSEAGSGKAVVLLHGLPFHRGLWAPQLPVLGRKFRVLAPDLPGFGESQVSAAEPSLDAWADDLALLMNHWACGPAIVAGHSMGGYLALAFQRRHPKLVSGLVMVSSRSTADTAEAAANRRSVAARLRKESPEFVAETMAPRMVDAQARDPLLVRQARALMDPLRAEGIAWAQLAIADRIDSTPMLGAVDVPALVVAGERDQVVPLDESGIMAASFRHGRIEVVEKSGHLPSFEQPAAFHSLFDRWAQKV